LNPRMLSSQLSTHKALTSNYALERAVKRRRWRAARVQKTFTLAARWRGLARAAQRGR
jgi:hypothetical protein